MSTQKINLELQNSSIKRKITANNIVKYVSQFFAWFLVLVFLGLIGYIIYESIPGFTEYGFEGIIFNNQYNINNSSEHQASVWLPLSITLLVTFGAIMIATPLSLKTSMLLHFRVSNPTLKKNLKIIINITAAIPSVIFGLFTSQMLGPVIKSIFGLETSYTVLTAIFMLAFMLIPTQISLILSACEGTDGTLINNTIALGNTKTKAIYKIFRSKIRKAIVIAIVVSAGRAIGETMAVSMILSSQNYNDVFNNGFLAILTSSLSPLGSVISVGMFSENGGEALRGLLYAFGIIMFVIVMIINTIVIIGNKKSNNKKESWLTKVEDKIGNFIMIVPNQLGILWEKITYHSPITLNANNYDKNMSKYISLRIKHNKTMYFYSWYKRFWEYLCGFIIFGFIAWISLAILSYGLYAISLSDSTVIQYGKDTTGQAILNTILLILISIFISLPISLIIAIWLNEYSNDNSIKKFILFFIDSLGATPSIIFGMFGLSFFIETLGVAAGGKMGNSILAGALTIVIVIIPTFTRMIQQALNAVPLSIRENSYALGNSKWYTIRKLVIPQAYKSIVSSTIISIGRILAETAPLYLTAGLSSGSKVVALLNPGQTITTRIYAQLFSNNSTDSVNIMWECALIALMLIIFIIFLGYVFIPAWPIIKEEIKLKWQIQKFIWLSNKKSVNVSQYISQTKNKTLYLTYPQAKSLGLELNIPIQVIKYNNKNLIVKLTNYKKMVKMEDEINFYRNKDKKSDSIPSKNYIFFDLEVFDINND